MPIQSTLTIAADGIGSPMKTFGSYVPVVTLKRASLIAPKTTNIAAISAPNLPNFAPTVR